MLFREIIALYSENLMNLITLRGQNAYIFNVKADGKYGSHYTLKEYDRIHLCSVLKIMKAGD
jgi:hypothetical protein